MTSARNHEKTRNTSDKQKDTTSLKTCGGIELIPYKLFFLFTYGAFGCLLTYLPLYFKQLGLSAAQTGVLIGLRPSLQAIGSPIWGFLADKYRRRKLVLFVAAIAWLCKNMFILAVQPTKQQCLVTYRNSTVSEIIPFNSSQFGKRNSFIELNVSNDGTNYSDSNILHTKSETNLLQMTTRPSYNTTVEYTFKIDEGETAVIFGILFALTFCGEFFGSILHPLMDGCLVDYLGDQRQTYGRVRLWGSIGVALASLMVGYVINESTSYLCGQIRKNFFIAFYFFGGFMAVGISSLFCIKIVYAEAPSKSDHSGVKTLFNSLPKVSFWIISVCLGLLDGFQMDFTAWFLDDIGTSASVIGLAASLHFFFNALTFFVASYVLDSIGYTNTISLGLLSYAALFVCFSFTYSPWLGLVLYVLCGCVFAVSWTACVAYVGSLASLVGLGGTAQGILSGLYTGLGSGGGTILGGALISATDIRTTYQLYATVAVVGLILYNVVQRLRNSTDESPSETPYQAVPSKEEDMRD